MNVYSYSAVSVIFEEIQRKAEFGVLKQHFDLKFGVLKQHFDLKEVNYQDQQE